MKDMTIITRHKWTIVIKTNEEWEANIPVIVCIENEGTKHKKLWEEGERV